MSIAVTAVGRDTYQQLTLQLIQALPRLCLLFDLMHKHPHMHRHAHAHTPMCANTHTVKQPGVMIKRLQYSCGTDAVPVAIKL